MAFLGRLIWTEPRLRRESRLRQVFQGMSHLMVGFIACLPPS